MAYRNLPIIYPPPKYPPDYLLDEFTMFGEMPIIKNHYFKPQSTGSKKHISLTLIHDLIKKLKRGENVNSYHDGLCVQHTLKRHLHYIKGKRGFVVGTIKTMVRRNATGVWCPKYNDPRICQPCV